MVLAKFERGILMSENKQYTVRFLNNSSNSGNACLYQYDPGKNISGLVSLAWLSKFTNPNTYARFAWEVTYDFVWSETSQLTPGVMVDAGQVLAADLIYQNLITLTYNGGYEFINPSTGPQAGNLNIVQDGTIIPNTASVGIGMAGSPTFLVPAQPNMNVVFTPHPRYWITFCDYQEGQVLDVVEMSNSVEIVFPANVTSMTAILNQDNTLTVQQTTAVNDKFIEARAKNGRGKWGEL